MPQVEITPSAPGGHQVFNDLSNADYHAEEQHDSSSTLRMFEESRATYYHTRISKRYKPKKTTDPMRLGTCKHIAILEPEQAPDLIAVAPKDVLNDNGERRGSKWTRFAWDNRTKEILTPDEYEAVKLQTEAVWGNPEVARLLEQCLIRERSVFFTTKDGDQLKARWDAADDIDPVIIDVKTTRESESEFWRSIKKYSYHRQAALYCKAFEAVHDVRPRFMYLILHEPADCYLRWLPSEAMSLGRYDNENTLAELRACKAGLRPWINPEHLNFSEIHLPPFFYPQG